MKRLIILFIGLLLIQPVSASWFDSSWNNRRNLNINWNISLNEFTKNIIDITEDGDVNYYQYSYCSKNNISNYIYISNETGYGTDRGYIEWNISRIPDNAIINNITFKYCCGNHQNDDSHINSMETQPSISSNETIWNDIGNGTTYSNVDGFPVMGEIGYINLSSAISDFESHLISDWFAIGLQLDNETSGNAYTTLCSEDHDTYDGGILIINYTYSPESLNYYQTNLNLSYSDIPEAQNDFDDIRFVNISDGASLPYWIEDQVNGSWCNVWVNVTSLHTEWNNDTVALYYGNSEATSMSNISTTFIFGDDFENGTITDKWEGDTGSYDMASGHLRCISTSFAVIRAKNSNMADMVIEYEAYGFNCSSSINEYGCALFRRQSNDNFLWGGYYDRLNVPRAEISKYIGGSHTNLAENSNIGACSDYSSSYWKIEVYGNITEVFADTYPTGQGESKLFYTGINSIISNSGMFGIFADYEDSYTEFDNYRVRKYAANPPIYILGNAETCIPPPTPPSIPSFTEIDLIDQLHHEYTHIEPQTMKVTIYIGLNYISIPLYQYNTSLNALFEDHPVTNDTIKKYINGSWNTSIYNNGTWINASNIEPIKPCIGYEYNRTGDNFTLNVSGYIKYNITTFNYENRVGTNIIRPMRCDKDD